MSHRRAGCFDLQDTGERQADHGDGADQHADVINRLLGSLIAKEGPAA